MSAEILVNVAPGETRVAQVEAGVLQEIHLQRDSRGGVAGNIYLGRVQRVLPGMQAAFVEIGLDRTAFLHAADIVRQRGEEDDIRPDIQHLLSAGESVLVQVAKEPLGSKGARLTTDLSIPSRYLVLMPHGDQAAVSTRIEDETERERLRAAVASLKSELGLRGGFIVRTVAEGADADALAADMRFLDRLWRSIREQVMHAAPGSLVHGDLPLVTRMLRDMVLSGIERVRIDDDRACREMADFARRFVPELAGRIEHYRGDGPIFDLFGVEDEIERALQPSVPLKSGGSIVIEQTEAMTTIDVNTAGYVGTRNLGETILKTNLEAAQTIARQLRLRNLGGIIIVDFIDMSETSHREQVLRALERALERDPAKSMISQISPLGLVEMTRKRTRESLEHVLCEPCPACSGRGSVKSVETVCHEIFREILRSARQFDTDGMLVLANPDVVAMLLDEQAGALGDLAESVARRVRLQAESLYLQEQFDVVPT
ncbi:Rne/Rng family ribonuclease [Salinisphaera sp. PC39]|uniref:ribonuclease G n=1 Tax=Salinisphaera sp. PC39 TaxID=1304156 RepID=UPI00333F606B